MKILAKVEAQHIGKLNLQKRGESGTRLQASPDPRDTTRLNQKSRVVA